VVRESPKMFRRWEDNLQFRNRPFAPYNIV